MANRTDGKVVTDIRHLTATLRAISDDVRSRVLEMGVEGACKPVLAAAKIYANKSTRTGALKASLTLKTEAYENNGVAVGLVGPDRNYFVGGKKITWTTGLLAGNTTADRPAWYAHLVEYGHAVVSPKKGTSIRKRTAKQAKNGKTFVAAKPFIRPAVLSTHAAQASGFESGLLKGFQTMKVPGLKG